jgi:hypothetical protein
MLGCAEGYFNLAPDSRLPRWFTLPEGITRAEVTLHETAYLSHSVFTLYDATGFPAWDPKGHKIARVCAVTGEPISLTETKNAEGGFDGNPYPLYEIVTVNGIPELLEYKRMEPVFYVSDDSEIRAKLGLPSTSK